ncbi:copper chaperone PCu(A)C [Streptomyces sp. AJS327]|uniref:copper chaperone PCu(A)C n=1 Tax=Streptomyces sp. AJS327 TaxID=2545265 RepID=UPI0015E0589C|nr:copper chaperone PCu(A)C [Streptomyces sp. AJS327]MBA0052728.1 copper chaperone PCu(A)C [Streptomyces sp. AJS327]
MTAAEPAPARPSPRTGGRRTRGGRTSGAAAALALALGLTACGSGSGDDPADDSGSGGGKPELTISGAYVPQPVLDDMAAGFLTVTNGGSAADTLTGVSSDLSATAELHTTKDQRMRQVRSLPVPADGSLRLTRGGHHVMLMDLKRKPRVGERVTLTLRFEKSGKRTVRVPVKATTHNPDTPAPDGSAGHDGSSDHKETPEHDGAPEHDGTTGSGSHDGH